jgi:ABC-type glutathione transport system ATPase component
MSAQVPLLAVQGLRVALGSGRRRVDVLHGIDLIVPRGATLGIVGESGSGKSTLAKTIVGIHRPQRGEIRFDGVDLVSADRRTRTGARRRIQYVPQDPYSSLDPRRTIAQTLAEALDPRRADRRRHAPRIAELLALVALDPDAAAKYPSEFSGGQRQRIAIARALAVEPDLVIADEITSALDVSTQADVLSLLAELKARLGLTLVFVSHNLAVVREISDDVAVLLHGEIVERGTASEVFGHPVADYTRELIAAVPGGPGFDLG